MAGDPGHEQHAAEKVDHRVAHAGRRPPGRPADHTTSVEAIAISSQKMKTVIRSPAKTTPSAEPA